jgi:pimeloyl-ACP methyl ester carboxylesterase
VLLSGAGLPARVWDAVRRELAPTRTVVARYPRGSGVSLADYADAVADQAPAGEVAVVGHSAGGAVAVELMARHPARVAAVLGLSAVVPRPGRSFLGTLPVPGRYVVGALVRLAGTRPPDRSVRTLARGLPAEVGDRLVRDFDPEEPGLFRDRVSAVLQPPAVRGYLRTTADREVPATVQRASAHALGATWTDELPTGHLPMLQDPPGVARAVRRLLDDLTG